MLVYFLAGITLLIIGKFFEQRYNVKKKYIKLIDYISKNEKNWRATFNNDIIENKKSQLLENIIGKGNDIYLIEKKGSEIKLYALNNEKSKSMSEFQYQGIMKKFENQDMFYTFNIDTGSIYYRFNPPYENYILWIYIN